MELDDLVRDLPLVRERLRRAREEIGQDFPWYLYDILSNVSVLDLLLTGENRDLGRLAAGLPVADIGTADGDLAFALEQQFGWSVDAIDHGPTNMNGLRGAARLRDHLGSRVAIHDVDLDAQFALPRERYGLVLLLGILYHLKNPFYVLERLAAQADHCVLSTRVARFAGPEEASIAELPVAYLVGPAETNNDATNFWMFSPAGLERIVDRTGWRVLDRYAHGAVENSDPSTPDRDERSFLLLRARRLP